MERPVTLAAPPVTIRRIRPSDAAALERFYEALSDDSRRTRFFALTRGLRAGQSAAFCATDHAHREGFVALVHDEFAGRRIVGHLCLEPAGDGTAEMAVAVADELQGRGIGRRLLDAGVAWARSTGVTRMTATMLATNGAIDRLVASLGLPTTRRATELDVIGIEVDLGPAAVAPRAA